MYKVVTMEILGCHVIEYWDVAQWTDKIRQPFVLEADHKLKPLEQGHHMTSNLKEVSKVNATHPSIGFKNLPTKCAEMAK